MKDRLTASHRRNLSKEQPKSRHHKAESHQRQGRADIGQLRPFGGKVSARIVGRREYSRRFGFHYVKKSRLIFNPESGGISITIVQPETCRRPVLTISLK